MNDLISRQAAIDALDRIFDRCEEIEAHLPEGDPDRVGYKMYPDWLTVWKYLRQVPSVQPTSTNAPNTLEPLDCVDRKAVLQRLTDISYNHCKTEGEEGDNK